MPSTYAALNNLLTAVSGAERARAQTPGLLGEYFEGGWSGKMLEANAGRTTSQDSS